MTGNLLNSFCDELIKIAGPSVKERVDTHFSSEKPDWSAFESGLKSSRFRKAVAGDSRADEKLRQYADAMGSYHSSRTIVGIVPSRTSDNHYKIKKLRSGRLGCNCKDWQYKHSHQGTDCDHVQMVKNRLPAEG